MVDELKKACQMVEEPSTNCLHYLRKSYGLPCACELINRCQHLLPIQEGEVVMFWEKLEIGSNIPEEHHRDMESKMRDLTSLLQEISTGPISNVREVRRLIKSVIHPVLPDDPSQPLSNTPETTVTKGRRKTNSTKRDKSHWEYVSISHRKIGKSSGLGFGSGSSSGLGSNPSPRGRGRPPRSGRSRGRGRSSGRSSLSTINLAGDGNCGFRVVSNFLLGDENHWVEIRRRMIFDLRHHMWTNIILILQLVDGCPLPHYMCNGNIIEICELVDKRPHIAIGWQIGLRNTMKCIRHRDILCNDVATCNL
ncbi:hypothetical protein M9H77_11896 [Catharanthus roseus]|uniref:Uncharacterized protein n=1 Tax=Catharanthus roseus TaxID=4058 RepID=A0ACC0BG16_CATRO|nr:hypothetical protein M9H77_11896 [Catharanthus roseus]